MNSLLRSACILTLIVAFVGSSLYIPQAYAQEVNLPPMPKPGVMIHLSPEFTPACLKGIVIHPENALKFDFIVYKGDKELTDAQKHEEYTKLAKYFLASLAIPDDDQWVNLSPYEKDRIIKDDFGKTEMGRDLLAQDYILKQITASLIYPEDNLGKKFWDKVYSEAQEQYGTSNIPVNTFNKVWIVPDDAEIYEKGNTAFVFKSHLKVMMEEDYLSLQKHTGIMSSPNKAHTIASKIVKEIVLPELEKEVNEGKNFASLRQVFSGMVLAAWYKRALKESLLSKIYADKAKVKGVDQDPRTNEAIYRQYLRAYKKGVFNYIKEDVNKYTNETIPRKYFSGGFVDKVGAILDIEHGATGVRGTAEAIDSYGGESNFAQVAIEAKELQQASAAMTPSQTNAAMTAVELSQNAEITVASNLLQMLNDLIHEASASGTSNIDDWKKMINGGDSFVTEEFESFVSQNTQDKGKLIGLLEDLFNRSKESSFKDFLEKYGTLSFTLIRLKSSSDEQRKILQKALSSLNVFSPGTVQVYDYRQIESINITGVKASMGPNMYTFNVPIQGLKQYQGLEDIRFIANGRDISREIKLGFDQDKPVVVTAVEAKSMSKTIPVTLVIAQKRKINIDTEMTPPSDASSAMVAMVGGKQLLSLSGDRKIYFEGSNVGYTKTAVVRVLKAMVRKKDSLPGHILSENLIITKIPKSDVGIVQFVINDFFTTYGWGYYSLQGRKTSRSYIGVHNGRDVDDFWNWINANIKNLQRSSPAMTTPQASPAMTAIVEKEDRVLFNFMKENRNYSIPQVLRAIKGIRHGGLQAPSHYGSIGLAVLDFAVKKLGIVRRVNMRRDGDLKFRNKDGSLNYELMNNEERRSIIDWLSNQEEMLGKKENLSESAFTIETQSRVFYPGETESFSPQQVVDAVAIINSRLEKSGQKWEVRSRSGEIESDVMRIALVQRKYGVSQDLSKQGRGFIWIVPDSKINSFKGWLEQQGRIAAKASKAQIANPAMTANQEFFAKKFLMDFNSIASRHHIDITGMNSDEIEQAGKVKMREELGAFFIRQYPKLQDNLPFVQFLVEGIQDELIVTVSTDGDLQVRFKAETRDISPFVSKYTQVLNSPDDLVAAFRMWSIDTVAEGARRAYLLDDHNLKTALPGTLIASFEIPLLKKIEYINQKILFDPIIIFVLSRSFYNVGRRLGVSERWKAPMTQTQVEEVIRYFRGNFGKPAELPYTDANGKRVMLTRMSDAFSPLSIEYSIKIIAPDGSIMEKPKGKEGFLRTENGARYIVQSNAKGEPVGYTPAELRDNEIIRYIIDKLLRPYSPGELRDLSKNFQILRDDSTKSIFTSGVNLNNNTALRSLTVSLHQLLVMHNVKTFKGNSVDHREQERRILDWLSKGAARASLQTSAAMTTRNQQTDQAMKAKDFLELWRRAGAAWGRVGVAWRSNIDLRDYVLTAIFAGSAVILYLYAPNRNNKSEQPKESPAYVAPASQPSSSIDKNSPTGGIDLNATNLNLRIKRNGAGVPLPLAQQDMAQLNQIDGLVPVILSIQSAAASPVLSELTAEAHP